MKNFLHEEKAYLVPEESQTQVRLSFDWIWKEGSLINSKNEWNYSHVPCAIVAHDGAIFKR